MSSGNPNSQEKSVARRWWDELERLASILGRVGPDEVCCEGLSQRQTAILRMLTEREGARLSDLAAAAGISPSAMTRSVERLEAAGLVKRVRGCCGDAREAIVRITDAGRAMRRQLDDLMMQRSESLALSIPADRRDQVLESLKLLNTAFESAGCCALNQPVVRIRTSNDERRTTSLPTSRDSRLATDVEVEDYD